MAVSAFTLEQDHSVLGHTTASEADYGTALCWAENAVGAQKAPCAFRDSPEKRVAESVLSGHFSKVAANNKQGRRALLHLPPLTQLPVIAGGKVISLTQLCDAAAAASNELSDSSRSSSSTRIVRESEPEGVRDCAFSNVTGEVSNGGENSARNSNL